MKLSVCLFTDSLEPSGVGEHMLALAAELQHRYRFSLVCPPSRSGSRLLERAGAADVEPLALEVRGDLESRERLRRWLAARGVDVFHGHAGIGWEGHDGIYAAREASVPIVLRTEHLPHLITDPGQREDHTRLVSVLDRLLCVSEQAHASFLAAGVPPDTLEVVRNGISTRPVKVDRRRARARLGLPPDARVVLNVGRLTEQKGHRYLVEAAPIVVDRVPNAHFLLIGEGPLESELLGQARRLGMERHITFGGRRDDVPELLAAADLFVLPSLFEGLPLAVLEAMAAGLPVVGTHGCGTVEAVANGTTGRLVEARDPTALAHAMLEVLEQPDLASRWGAAGRTRFEQEFSAARMARETAVVYDELAQRLARAEVPRDLSIAG